jgi:predicted DNA-binding helix-hairpin-helix protein
MEIESKLEALGDGARYDLCNSCAGPGASRRRDALDRCIYPAVLPDGKRLRLLKVLQTNMCQNDCWFCSARASTPGNRVSFAPEELAGAFMQMLARRQVQGIFLSSGIAGGAPHTMDRLLATAETLRRRHRYAGCMHLKIMPGAEFAQVEAAVSLADRVSLNLEAPDAAILLRIAGKKDFEDGMLTRMRWVKQLADKGLATRSGQTTQFVVGAAGESDRQIPTTTDRLYRELSLARAYFSAFSPVHGTPLEGRPPTPPAREHRLYQADWLLRFYDFRLDELAFDATSNLPLDTDPKLLWAERHPERFPVEMNTAARADLLRVPGIGPRAADRLLLMRRQGRLVQADCLKSAGATVSRAAPFVLLDGRPAAPRQMRLF